MPGRGDNLDIKKSRKRVTRPLRNPIEREITLLIVPARIHYADNNLSDLKVKIEPRPF